MRTPLTLVVAPAGTGKTSLLSGWAAESTIRTAWLSLDETDGDAARFWSGVIAAVETVVPGCGERALAPLRRAAPVEAVDQLLEDLEASAGSPTILVVDDLHHAVDDDVVAASLALFLEHLPAWLHVVLVSRRVPRLSLARLRARGRLAEVRFAELRFSPFEARELLSRLDPSLAGERVDAAVREADGWAAALQMAALTARSARAQEDDEAPGSSDLMVHDYVVREVLASEGQDLIDALSDVAIVRRVNASLARALTGRDDAADLLRRAETRGLFVTRLDPQGWYEVHSPIRAALVAELSNPPKRLVEQHVRAARWFEDEGELPLALEHWLLAGRPREALRLLAAESAELYDRGQEAILTRTIAAIPAAVAMTDLESMLDLAWCHLFVSRRRFLETVEQATWWARQSVPLDPMPSARLAILQSMAATMSGYSVEGAGLARQALVELGDTWWRDRLGRFAWNTIALEIALSERWVDHDDGVRAARLATSRDLDRYVAFEGTRALGEALSGQPVQALRVAAGVRQAAAVSDRVIPGSELSIAEAVAHREIGDRSRAVVELEGLSEAPTEATPYVRILASLELVQAHLDRADLAAARHSFEEMQALVEIESFGPDGRGWLARAGALLALAAGEIDDARRWADQLHDPFWGGSSVARVLLAEGDRPGALAALETARPRCVRHEVVLGLLRARAVGDGDESVKGATAAMELAAANGLLQTVVSEGADIADLIERAAWRLPRPWLDRLRRALVAGGDPSPVARRHPAQPLTERERDVLRFLPSRFTIREIADELGVSVNTLKFHLKVIYRKLGVNSRAEAAARAREPTFR